MKLNKEIAIILVLSSLLLSALGVAFYFYNQGEAALISNNKLKVVYVAAKNIPKHTKITKKDLKPRNIAQKFIINKALLPNDIIGKYTIEKIYKNDTYTKEKLIKSLPKKQTNIVKVKKDTYKYTSYNMEFRMFRNPNYSLKPGDTIDIISVYKSMKPKANGSSNEVQYIAKSNKVLAFMSNGIKTDQTMKKVKRTRVVKKKTITDEITLKANEIILDIRKKDILRLIDDYNRGSQLWMVQTKHSIEKKKNIVSVKSNVKRSYPYKLYKSRGSNENLQATIHYADQENASVTKSKLIKLDYSNKCLNSDLYLMGISNKIHLRTGPSNGHKIARIVYRNYIIPYTNSVDSSWYRTCDGYYIHKLEAKELTKKQAMMRLGK